MYLVFTQKSHSYIVHNPASVYIYMALLHNRKVLSHTRHKWNVHRWNTAMGREFVCSVTIVFVFSLIVFIVNGTKASCPCATEQQCEVIKDDKRKEVSGKIVYLWSDHMMGVLISCNICCMYMNIIYEISFNALVYIYM